MCLIKSYCFLTKQSNFLRTLLIFSSKDITYRTKALVYCIYLIKFVTILCCILEYSDFCSWQTEKLKRNMINIVNPESVKSFIVTTHCDSLGDVVMLLTYIIVDRRSSRDFQQVLSNNNHYCLRMQPSWWSCLWLSVPL